MILNQTNTHMVLLLSGITLRQHIMLTSAIEGEKKKKNENAQQPRDSGCILGAKISNRINLYVYR